MQKAAGPTPLGPRKRRAINYREGMTPAKAKVAVVVEEDPGSDKEDFDPDNSHSSEESDVDLDEARPLCLKYYHLCGVLSLMPLLRQLADAIKLFSR